MDEDGLMEWMKDVFAPPAKDMVRYFWLDGLWYKVEKGKYFVKHTDGNYYKCCLLNFKVGDGKEKKVVFGMQEKSTGE